MDGDGISDLIHTPYSQEVSYYLNGGDGLWGEVVAAPYSVRKIFSPSQCAGNHPSL